MKSGTGMDKSVDCALCHRASMHVSHFSSQLYVPKDKKPLARIPQGWPLDDVFVRQQLPRNEIPSKLSELKLHLCASANLRLDQTQIRMEPSRITSEMGQDDIKILRSN